MPERTAFLAFPAFVVAGTKSGSGKTSFSLGLMAALARRGLRVQPFKAGPDFIDPGHHNLACSFGNQPAISHNLDTWMLSEQAVRDIFARYAPEADVVIVEGVMGLFDGVSGQDELGSSAHLAKVLGLPVVLVADVSSMARSAAALVSGYARFDPELNLAGVVLNNVASPGHGELLRQALGAVREQGGPPCPPLLGLLPRQEDINLPSRHLGLVMAGEGAGEGAEKEGGPDSVYARLADWVEESIDLDELLTAVRQARPDLSASLSGSLSGPMSGPLPTPSSASQSGRPRTGTRPISAPQSARPEQVQPETSAPQPGYPQPGYPRSGRPQSGRPQSGPSETGPTETSAPLIKTPLTSTPGQRVRLGLAPVRIGMAKDAAFCFVYEENLRLLRQAGAEIVCFSPLTDPALPPDLDGLYLPGGYPELHGAPLAANASLREQVRAFCASRRPVYAECGGFMYLMQGLEDAQGRVWDMAGVFEARASMGKRFSALGYREAAFTAFTPLGPAGTVLRGHEFHYSHLSADPANAKPVYAVTSRRGPETITGWLVGNTLGSYIHLHFGSNPEAASHLVQACMGQAHRRSSGGGIKPT